MRSACPTLPDLRSTLRGFGACAALTVVLLACSDALDDNATATPEPRTDIEVRAGGRGTTFDDTDRAFNRSARNLLLPDARRFALGDDDFERIWTTDEGKGFVYNGSGCVECHVNNGRSQRPGDGPLTIIGPVLRLSVGVDESGAPILHPELGRQIQDIAEPGFEPEGTLVIEWVATEGLFDDGQRYVLEHPDVTVDGADLGAAVTSLRAAPPVIGTGLLEAIPDAVLLGFADPDDADGDGISGEVQVLADGRVGRFGWKATQATVLDQSNAAYDEDIGLRDDVVDNVEERRILTSFYAEALAVPATRDLDDPDVQQGAAIFREIGCASCHIDTAVETGEGTASGLSHQMIIPYTDLLLHDMGPGLADGFEAFNASGSEWRTPTLWGLGLAETINPNGVGYLHDGRARTVEEAVLWHGGEAASAADRYRSLTDDQRRQLLAFLAAL